MVKKISEQDIKDQFNSSVDPLEDSPEGTEAQSDEADEYLQKVMEENSGLMDTLAESEEQEKAQNATPVQEEKVVSEELIDYLEERQILSEKTDGGHLVVIGLAIGVVIFCLWTSYKLIRDDSLQIFSCPESRELDAPVAMKRIRDFGSSNVEIYLRGFTRQFLRAMHPKNSTEASYMYKWLADHTTGRLHSEYLGYDNDHVKIGQALDQGRSTDFFPARPSAHKDGIRISKVKGSSDRWIVEVGGFLNDRKTMIQDDRGAVNIRLSVFLGEAKLNGSQSGLYVSKIEILSLTDPVADNVEAVK